MNLRWRPTVWLAFVLVGMVLLGGSVAVLAADLRPHSQQVIHRSHSASDPSVQPAPDQYSPAPPRAQAPAPRRLIIPTIGVDAAVEKVEVDANPQMGVPQDPADVGWYSLGSSPGQPGDAVIDGHLDTATGAPAVFARLSSLKPGDSVRVRWPDERELEFRVEQVSRVPYRAMPPGLYSTEGPSKLTLITCTGAWDTNQHVYTERLVVQALPVNS